MPLALNDPRWSELRSSYGGTEDVIRWLGEAEEEGGLSHERLGDLVNEVQHQGGTSTAMYAVATHLIALARRTSPEMALSLLIHAGMIYGHAGRSDAVACPAFLKDEFVASAPEGARLLAPLLLLAPVFESYKYGVAGLAGFLGYDRFARFLDGLDDYEGQFHHVLLEGPFPPEV